MNLERLKELFGPARRGVFVTTHWSVVLTAAGDDSTASQDALAELCAVYWYPLYAFARRYGQSADDAKDSVQGFFARVLQSRWLDGASPERGKFRSWLLACFKHHLADERARAGAQKRGAGQTLLSLDTLDFEERFALEPADPTTPEKLYDRRWALTVLDQTFGRLRVVLQDEGKGALFEALEQSLPGGTGEVSYPEIARRLGMTEGAIRVAVHRLRERYRQTLREEIGRTVQFPEQIDEEIRHLMSVLAEEG